MRAFALLLTLTTPMAAQTALHQQIVDIAKDAKGTVYVACSLPGTTLDCDLNQHGHPPMQSTFKFPLAMAVLHQIEIGKLQLDQPVRFLKSDRSATYSPLQDEFPEADVDVSLRKLIELSVETSDNTATDIELRLIGGPAVLQQYLDSLGFTAIHQQDNEHTLHGDQKLQYRDYAEPAAMVALLRLLADHSPLDSEHTTLLNTWMLDATSGPQRIKGMLPGGTPVAHKTGSSGEEFGMIPATNDVGLITLPDGRRLAIAVFVTDAHADQATCEAVIARIARAIYGSAVAAAVHIHAQRPQSLFYLTRDPGSVQSFLAHADKVDALVPNWYAVDANGLVSGGPNPIVMEAARQHRVAVMPLVVNAGFVPEDMHKLLVSSAAHAQIFEQLIHACKENGYVGMQLDFESVPWTDRDALSAMVREAGAAFHKAGLQLSIATIPNAPGTAGETGFSAWMYQTWRGAYDLKAIAESVDLVCLMTYDQHSGWTVPGPVGGWTWTTENLDYALKTVPAQKLALGIPIYGYHWFSGTPIKGADKSDKPNPTADYISTPDALDLAKAYNGHLEWDSSERTASMYFYRDGVREWIFYTDARTFRERYTLVKDRGLRGFASWVLGMEDPGIWDLLPSHTGS